MRRFVALFAVLGCGGSAPQTARPAPVRTDLAGVESDVPRAPYGVVPAELADEGIGEKLRHRVVLRRWTTAFLRPDDSDGKLQEDESQRGDTKDILPVIDEVPRFLRVVIENNKARYAVWVSRADVAPTVLAPTRLVTRDAKVTETSGVWLEPGVQLAVLNSERDVRRVQVVDDELVSEGYAPGARVGNVWVVPPGGSLASNMKRDDLRSWEVRSDRGPLIKLAARTEVRGRPGSDGIVVATFKDNQLVAARMAPSRDGWTEIEVSRPYVRVRGFVADAAVLGPSEATGTASIAGGRVFGMTHAYRHDVEAGACLYDRKDGEVIGVQLEKGERLGGQIIDGWAMIYVDTPWSVANMWVKNIAPDPAGPPVWDACTQGPHR